MITKRRKQILSFVTEYQKNKGYAPSLEEICKKFKLASVSTAHFHVSKLCDAGYLTKEKNKPRAIDVMKREEIIKIPIVGTIAAGQPIEAIEVPDKTIAVTKNEIGKSGNHYALRVQGNSMIDEGIFDGDIVVIRQQPVADNGQTVVAIINDNEATLKKIYREKDRFRLQPANPSLFPIYTKELEVRGVVVKIIRNFERQIEREKTSDHKLQRRVDYSWDFNGAKTKPYTHGLHTYPAMFIPQVARRLLLNYSKKGNTICDIFCGSGTALIESRLLGRNSYGIDLNPLAIFLAKVKTTPINPRLLSKEYIKLLIRVNKIKNTEVEKPQFKNLEFWFKDKIIIELAKIKKAIKEIKDRKIQNFFLVAFSEAARKSSNTKRGEFKLVRIKKEDLEKYNPNVLEIFKQKAELNIKAMEEFYRDVDRNTWAKIIFGDSSKDNSIKEDSIDCIVTSPPYGDSRTTVAYGQFSRLSAQWIDIFNNPDDASKVDNELLGGRATKTLSHVLSSNYLNDSLDKIAKQDENRAKDVLSFYIGLNDCLKRAYEILKPKKYFCLVIGNRLVKQVRIPTDFIIAELGEKIGFTCEDIFIRNISGKRMPIKNSPTNIVGALEETMNRESIVILRKN
ncbi:transcriptional repressor LexA [Patescibacteria group bacterium]|nr:transcriptional repressor LexA [Patescibacteria group bacterium]MBU4274574.1 transcriptional repressor LexA [Patescibacteria group bacterium]MBU4367346.1 transcriptional repressor LexA [Patescibacteria group bacterium]MBU4462175.1 transcriptional repressor LexA [Patescibacteria group bacterium]MCG2699734.1 transcriptional repressor LexA [Candidatus Parcubacteria bacterium]